jgi:hypothetical protein
MKVFTVAALAVLVISSSALAVEWYGEIAPGTPVIACADIGDREALIGDAELLAGGTCEATEVHVDDMMMSVRVELLDSLRRNFTESYHSETTLEFIRDGRVLYAVVVPEDEVLTTEAKLKEDLRGMRAIKGSL